MLDDLGQAAGQGNEQALNTLIDPESHLLLRSSAVPALKAAADAGNERAIQALVATAADPKQQALWSLAAQGLETAAAAGNATAIDSLAQIAGATNQNSSKQSVLALEAAARNQQPRAEDALRKLGWRSQLCSVKSCLRRAGRHIRRLNQRRANYSEKRI